MKIYRILGFSVLLTSGVASAQCPGVSKSHARLQWSESTTVVAPDRVWEAEVHPILDADQNRTPVTLHKCAGTATRSLFTLERSAELYWSPDSSHLLVINEPLSGTNKLLLFSVVSPTVGAQRTPPDALDRMVNEALMERLGQKKHVQFYLPRFVSWKRNDLVLAVGGAAYVLNVGPLDTYCYGIRINSLTLRVERVLSEKELKASTGNSCQVSP